METPLRVTENFKIRTYETDFHKTATIPALIRLLHEAAMRHVIQLKLSIWDLEDHRISWVLMRKQLRVFRLPALHETVTVTTYPSGYDKFFTYRDYHLHSSSGELLAEASSSWLLMDLDTRKMARIPDFILDPLIELFPPEEACLPRPTGKYPAFTEATLQQDYKVHWHDLDFNGHLNNITYVQWMLDTLPMETLRNRQLQQVDITYRLECSFDDLIRVEVQALDRNRFLHRMIRVFDNKELAQALSVWD